MQSILSRMAVVTMVWAGISHIAVVESATIYPLYPLDSGRFGRGYSVNDSGQVAVTSFQLFGEGTAYRFDGPPGDGGILHNLGALPGDQHAFSSAINASGQVAGHSQQTTVFSPTRAFRYDGTPGVDGIMRDLGTLGGLNSIATGINDFGQVTGSADGIFDGTLQPQFAFVYDGTPGAGGVMRSLGSLGSSMSIGAAINNAGQVAGTSQLVLGGANHAFRYDGPAGSGTMSDLGMLPGFTSSYATAMNASGQVVGASESADVGHAFIYTGTPGVDGEMTDLGVPLGGSVSVAVAINDAGYVLGGSSDASDLYFLPVLWRPDGSFVDLDAWLDATNPDLGQYWDFRYSFITGISNNGLITGDALYTPPGASDGSYVAFVLDASRLVPEPMNLGWFGVIACYVLCRRAKAARQRTAQSVERRTAPAILRRGASWCFAICVTQSVQAAEITPIGALGLGVSGDGTIVVGAENPTLDDPGYLQVSRWTSAGGTQSLGRGAAYDISRDGTTLVGERPVGDTLLPFQWTANHGFTDLGTLPGGAGGHAYDVSGDGGVVVGLANQLSGNWRGFRWTPLAGMVALGDLPGGFSFSQAFSISADGQVTVGTSSSGEGDRAVRWLGASTVPIDIGLPPGLSGFTEARGVSGDGKVIVGVWGTGAENEAFRWTESGGYQLLGDLPGGLVDSVGYQTNYDGSVIVGIGNPGDDIPDEAFYWTAARGMRSLRDVLLDAGADLSAWQNLNVATALSDDGRVIVGSGTLIDGTFAGFRASLQVPEPSVAALMILPGMGLAMWRRKRLSEQPR